MIPTLIVLCAWGAVVLLWLLAVTRDQATLLARLQRLELACDDLALAHKPKRVRQVRVTQTRIDEPAGGEA